MSKITCDVFGKLKSGEDVLRYKLINSNGVVVEILSLGATIRSVCLPDKTKGLVDVTTGYDDCSKYETNVCSFGCVVGRCANRIKEGKFQLDDQEYQLECNNGPNHLHGGTNHFGRRLYKSQIEGNTVVLNLVSEDGDEGYPGRLDLQVAYELTNENQLLINYVGTTDRPTIVNVTAHPYFNMAGHNNGNIYDHTLTVYSDKFTPKDDTGIPTGEIASVRNTVFDLTEGRLLGDIVNNIPGDLGLDHNFCFGERKGMQKNVCLEHAASGRSVIVSSDQPGVQIYTANYMNESVGCKDSANYTQHCAVAIETQNYPDAINQKSFPSAVLRPGQTYKHLCCYEFVFPHGVAANATS